MRLSIMSAVVCFCLLFGTGTASVAQSVVHHSITCSTDPANVHQCGVGSPGTGHHFDPTAHTVHQSGNGAHWHDTSSHRDSHQVDPSARAQIGTMHQWHAGAFGDHHAAGQQTSSDTTNSSHHHHSFQDHNPSNTWFGVNGSHFWAGLPSGHTHQVNLDLASTATSATGGHLLGNRTVDIKVGNSQLAVAATTPLTQAEKIAVMQVFRTGTQSLLIDGRGTADGGSLTIGPGWSSHIGTLIIPHGVTVTDVSRTGVLNVAGSLVDNGSLYLTSSNPAATGFSLTAGNIAIGAQGIISTPGTLNLNVASGNLTNNGLIASTHGSINISAPSAGTNINLNAAGGAFQASNGSITVRDSSYAGAANINLNGGNYLSHDVNFYSGSGAINGQVGNVSGNWNSYAQVEHVLADTPVWHLANNTITGDPTFASTGSIIIDGSLNFGANNVAVIAGGDITSGTATNQAQIITSGGNVTLIAGADLTCAGCGISGTATTSPISGTASSVTGVTMQFDSSAGGNVDLTNSGLSPVIQTSGGSVSIAAHSNSSTNGNVWFNTSGTSIDTSNGSGAAGSVLAVAGGAGGGAGNPSSAIQLGGVNTGAGSNGSVYLYAAQPVASGGSLVFDGNGNITTGALPTSASSYSFSTTGAVSLNGNITSPSSVAIQTGSGNIVGNSASIQAPTIALTSASGNVAADSAGAGPLSVNNAGAGLSLAASGRTVNLKDSKNEAVSLSGVSGANSLTISAVGNIVAPPAGLSGTSGSNFVFSSFNGTAGQTFTGASFSKNGIVSNQVQVTIGGDLYLATIFITPNGGAITFVDQSDSSKRFVVLNNTGGALGSDANAMSGLLNSFFVNNSKLDIIGPVQSPVINLTSTGGNIGGNAAASTALQFGNGGSGVSLSLSANAGKVNLTDTNNETVSLTSLNSATSFTLSTVGNIVAGSSSISGTSGNSFTFSSFNGSVGQTFTGASFQQNGMVPNQVQVTIGGDLYLATLAGTGNGRPITFIDQSDNSKQFVVLNNTGFPLSSSALLVSPLLNSFFVNNSRLSPTGQVGGASISLTSSNGNIGGNATASTPLNIGNSGGGLFLSASGSTVNLQDSFAENVQINNSSAASSATTVFTLSATNGITSSASTIAITSPAISLTATSGNIGANTTASTPLQIGNSGAGTSLFASGNTVNLQDAFAENVQINNSSAPSVATNAFTLSAANGISSSNSNVALQSPSISLQSANGDIVSITSSTPLAVQSGTAPGSLVLSSQAGGSSFLTDLLGGDAITLNTSAAGAEFSLVAPGTLTVAQNVSVAGPASRIDLTSGGTITLAPTATISTTSAAVTGGLIQFQSTLHPLTVINNGSITATNSNNSSIVGFNSGASGGAKVTGTGTITAGKINVGNLSSSTLAINPPFISMSSSGPFNFSLGNNMVQQNSIIGLVQISGVLPVVPVTAVVAPTSAATTITAPPLAASSAKSLQLPVVIRPSSDNFRLYEQIGTKTATDYTPIQWPRTTDFPLRGLIIDTVVGFPGEARFFATAFNAEELDALGRQGIVYGSASKEDLLDLLKGSLFFLPQSDITVRLREGTVFIPKDAAVLIVETGADSAIYDFDDTAHSGSVKVTVNNKPFSLSPGTQVVLTRDFNSGFAAINPGSGIAYRNVRSGDAGAGIKAYIADFSIPHGFASVNVIRTMLLSKDPRQIRAARRILKNAAILADLTGFNYKTSSAK